MAKCAICEKGVHYGNNVSHSHRRSNHVWKSNIKKVSCKDKNRRFLPAVFLYPQTATSSYISYFDIQKNRRNYKLAVSPVITYLL